MHNCYVVYSSLFKSVLVLSKILIIYYSHYILELFALITKLSYSL